MSADLTADARILRAHAIVERVRERCGARLGLNTTALLLSILAEAPRHEHVSDLLAEIGVAQTSARWRLNKKLLPGPAAWFQLGRGLHAADVMRAQPGVSLVTLAVELGYSDHGALCHTTRRLFGLRTREVRATAGWEPLVTRWMDRKLAPKAVAA